MVGPLGFDCEFQCDIMGVCHGGGCGGAWGDVAHALYIQLVFALAHWY